MPSLSLPDGTTLGYDDTGHGDPVILLHGHPFDRTMWRPQVERLAAEGFRVVVPDLRGYGTSRLPTTEDAAPVTPFDRHAADLTALLDELGIDTFVLGGLSMGGQLVMECHRHLADRIDAVLLAATSARADTPEQKRERLATAERLTREGMSTLPGELLPRMLSAESIRALPATTKHVLRMMRATPPDGAAASLRGRADRADYVEHLAHITVPTLVVVGTEDTYTPVAEAELLHTHIAGSQLVVLDGVGHLPNLEREVEFDDHLVKFLRTQKRS
ncbi:alpha/beta fold hydrolase [Saccharomonospora xinjiangensis]|uniref:Putative hydrolase or acyltransferase of alpha/beta superfamily n=1 Tax=Saccharomonospora xinjiangensis XJ-54 TaxID=882086 RepID=I0UYX7_9PSEU|nr:alpha/beta fold hydrolase [Saccharomonospora xinjiangensis]EID53080.1 putative hydrolase or acyltransferase of alpha/beta superfamily [Saccharomonospora xinjiangensis XJ-54]